jgi:hypothetical protein
MAGAITISIAILLTPVVIGVSAVFAAGILGHFLNRNAELQNEGSELLESNY